MRAAITTAYGDSDVLEIQDVPAPKVKRNTVLVKVYASSVNPIDWKIRRGDVKIITGRTPPRILGGDFAGEVLKIGGGVKGFKKGDKVYGLVPANKGGAYAEVLRVKKDNLCHMPTGLSFEEAASVPLASMTALQSLQDLAALEKGDNVLITGCTGGVGAPAVQIAKTLGAKVTGTCSARNMSHARALGADEVLDYTKETGVKVKDAYDVVFDAAGSLSFRKCNRSMRAGGIYVRTLPSFDTLVLGGLLNLVGSKRRKHVMVKSNTADLETLKSWLESGALTPQVAEVYPLSEIATAHSQSQSGTVRGKIVIRIAE